MTTALTERPGTATPVSRPNTTDAIDRDGLEVYCPEAEGWGRTRDLFCESCGATDHDLR